MTVQQQFDAGSTTPGLRPRTVSSANTLVEPFAQPDCDTAVSGEGYETPSSICMEPNFRSKLTF